MSHRDEGVDITPGSSAQQLIEALRWSFRDADFAGCRFRSRNSFSAWGLVVTSVLWVWSERRNLTERFGEANQLARWLFPDEVTRTISYQAFGKQLLRWTERLMPSLKDSLRQRMRSDLSSRFLVGDHVLFGIDGTKLGLPRTKSHEACYCPHSTRLKQETRLSRKRSMQSRSARMKKAQRPQMWLTMLWHAGSGLPWDWRLGPSDSSERGHLNEMLDELPPKSLIAADAGFLGYDHWLSMLVGGHQFVIRVGSNVRLLKHLGYVRESAGTVYLWPDADRKRQGPPLILRHVIIHDGRAPCHLITSILNRRELSNRQVAEVYRLRWGIEVYYRHFKQTFERNKLRSHEAVHARCEAIWSLAGLWALLLYATACRDRLGLPPRKLSVANVLRACRDAMRTPQEQTDRDRKLIHRLALAVTDSYQRQSKQSRDYPQRKIDPPPKPPQLQPATPQQQLDAKKIKQLMKG
ncbi:IS4 family transposase [Calycomorphotria hydatis]|uniref:Transposase DDE domain protein n=1 Tax=Calycomorphotria hydatis TaxID=2528027 RepID=A0A517TD96_9PLAN|nr:IS4 family transposase [Calycomorphotria hydatis]QDT66346.1 Transposase DDE domain protein [Calycomorphotria hydatis]